MRVDFLDLSNIIVNCTFFFALIFHEHDWEYFKSDTVIPGYISWAGCYLDIFHVSCLCGPVKEQWILTAPWTCPSILFFSHPWWNLQQVLYFSLIQVDILEAFMGYGSDMGKIHVWITIFICTGNAWISIYSLGNCLIFYWVTYFHKWIWN